MPATVTLAIFAPPWVVPLLVRDAGTARRRWYESYWLKFTGQATEVAGRRR
jgi:hypothetical protein